MSIAIRYPGDPSGLRGRAHDPAKDLHNPEPRTDWARGDVAWVYHKDRVRAICGVITNATHDGGGWYSLKDLSVSKEDYGVDTVHCDGDELFPDLESLLAAFFLEASTGASGCGTPDNGSWFICYDHPEAGPTYEVVNGEDAMRQRVHDLTMSLDIDPEEGIHVFPSSGKI